MGLLIMTQMVMMQKGTTGKRHDCTLNMQKVLLKETKERKQPVQMFCACEEIRSDCFSIVFFFFFFFFLIQFNVPSKIISAHMRQANQ